ncbi:hypothetical protein NH286_09165, partial [Anaerococcus sp. NML200574]|uniref:hypothetical protein n=1 Tax=Anaerococcus sp. NML200574 TaxID=2954486 RepID=UPI0022379A19
LANLFKLISPSSYSFITFFFNSKLYFFIAASFLATTFGESYRGLCRPLSVPPYYEDSIVYKYY